MEEQIKTQRKKLLISFSGCTKKDNSDNGEGSKRYNPMGINGRDIYRAKQLSLQLAYKF